MSAYTDRVSDWCRPHEGLSYVTLAPLRWEVGAKGSGLWVEVPVGVVFDVSVPRLFRWLFSPRDWRYLAAACLHDWTLGATPDGRGLGWDRWTAAAIFQGALAADGVGPVERWVMTQAVILGRRV